MHNIEDTSLVSDQTRNSENDDANAQPSIPKEDRECQNNSPNHVIDQRRDSAGSTIFFRRLLVHTNLGMIIKKRIKFLEIKKY